MNEFEWKPFNPVEAAKQKLPIVTFGPPSYEVLRLEFIKAAMQGLCTNRHYPLDISRLAVGVAEATLKEAGVQKP